MPQLEVSDQNKYYSHIQNESNILYNIVVKNSSMTQNLISKVTVVDT